MAEQKKPTAGENEFFSKEEELAIRKLREKLDKERQGREAAQLKAAHWMRCPKCGGKMHEAPFQQVVVDRCESCGYVGFDRGELEIVAGRDQSGVLRHVLGLFKGK